MYLPKPFEQSDRDTLFAFIRQSNFATLATARGGEALISHVPLYRATEGGKEYLIGHLARANDHWQAIEGPGTAVFHGPHAYVSSKWYETRNVVPTWNYVAVHVSGSISVTGPEGLEDIIARTLDEHEGDAAAFKASMDPSALSHLMQHIVGIRMEITGMEGKWKLSQNKPAEARARIADRLSESDDWNARKVAELMRAAL